jgi:hypothetical protein
VVWELIAVLYCFSSQISHLKCVNEKVEILIIQGKISVVKKVYACAEFSVCTEIFFTLLVEGLAECLLKHNREFYKID